jgi:hypothetical protein
MIYAVLMKENKKIQNFFLDISAYGLDVYDRSITLNEKLSMELLCRSREYLKRGIVTREELERLGGERPEGYVYAYACANQFQLPDDDIWVSYPNEDYFSLYPADFTYRYIHKLTKHKVSLSFTDFHV